jgi:hypothetical protein
MYMIGMTTLESLNKGKGLNVRELKDLENIDSGKSKITRYKNVHAYLRHLDKESKK